MAFSPCFEKSLSNAQITASLNLLREPRNRPVGLPIPTAPTSLRCFAATAGRPGPCTHVRSSEGCPSKPAGQLGQIHREALEIGERAIAQRAFMGGAQDHARRLARLQRFLPTRRTETPTIAGLEPGKAEFRHRRRKIIAAGFGEGEKRGSHHRAHRVAADVLRTGIAAAVAKEAGHGRYRAELEPLAEHVAGRARPTASVTPVVPKHLALRVPSRPRFPSSAKTS